jgi:DNA-binding Xre family transcriptional regulator
MPLIKTQDMKAISTVLGQPQNITSKIKLMILLDISGHNGKQISEQIGISENRVSIIRNTPMYVEEKEKTFTELKKTCIDKKSDVVAYGDPVERVLKDNALAAANEKIRLMREGNNEFIRSSAAGDILDRAGYKPHTEKTKVEINITDKMADRFERVLDQSRGLESNRVKHDFGDPDEYNSDERTTSVKITKTMSS